MEDSFLAAALIGETEDGFLAAALRGEGLPVPLRVDQAMPPAIVLSP